MLIEYSLIISSCCLFFHKMLLMELIITLHLYYNDAQHSSNGCWLAAIFLCHHIVLSFVVDPSLRLALPRMTPQLAIWIPGGSANSLVVSWCTMELCLIYLFILYSLMLGCYPVHCFSTTLPLYPCSFVLTYRLMLIHVHCIFSYLLCELEMKKTCIL